LNEETTLYTIICQQQNKFFVVRRGRGGDEKQKNKEHDVNMYIYINHGGRSSRPNMTGLCGRSTF